MPTFFLDTPDIAPLPSLQVYTTVSVLLISCSVYYAFQVTSEPDWKLNATLSVGLTLSSENNNKSTYEGGGGTSGNLYDLPSNIANETSLQLGLLLENPVIVRIIDVLYLMLHEPMCIWTLINMAFCVLVLTGKLIQKLVFGELRVSEQQHIKDKLWNFAFYKFIFIFGVLNVQYMDEIVLWCSWFSILGFLCLLAQLCKDRFEYLSFSPMTPKWIHVRLLLLLFSILMSSLSLFALSILVGIHAGFNTFAFMAAEVTLVAVRTLYVITKYAIHLWDLNYDGVWENRSSYSYYAELIFELSNSTIDFCHNLHMLFWGNIILSMASLVILMQLRYLFYEIKRRIKKHQNYLLVIQLMEANFPMATPDEIEKNSDDCAICWDRMEVARKLPCGHLFHNSCLRSWLEQDTSCPTCRTSLKARSGTNEERDGRGLNDGDESGVRGNVNRGPNHTHTRAHFWQFDGSRYARWLPTISVQVSRTIGVTSTVTTVDVNSNADGTTGSPLTTTQQQQQQQQQQRQLQEQQQLESMALQVQEWFPLTPLTVILEDLRVTRSIELTMENILDGNLRTSPTTSQAVNSSSSSSSASSSSNQSASLMSSRSITSDPNGDDAHQASASSDDSSQSKLNESATTTTPSTTTTTDEITSKTNCLSEKTNPSLPKSLNSIDSIAINDEGDGGHSSYFPSSISSSSISPSSSSSLALTSPSSSSCSVSNIPLASQKVYCGRFSKSPGERVKMLFQRKEDLLETARKAYLLKQRNLSKSSSSPSPSSSSSSLNIRHNQLATAKTTTSTSINSTTSTTSSNTTTTTTSLPSTSQSHSLKTSPSPSSSSSS